MRAQDTVTAVAVVTEVDRVRRRCRLATKCIVGDTIVVEGEALLLVPSRAPAEAEAS